MKNKWIKIISTGLILIALATTIIGCPGPNPTAAPVTKAVTDTTGAAIPQVTLKRLAPNTLDLPGITKVDLATPDNGAFLVNDRAKIWVPPGAVASATPVTITEFMQNPAGLTSGEPNAVPVAVISNFYDFGPDNTSFNNPVVVTLAYSEKALPAGADKNKIYPVYFNGVNWVPLQRQIDTEENTVSFEVKSFPGFVVFVAFGIEWGVTAVTALTAATVGATAVLYNEAASPLYWNKGGEYVTPDDPIVVGWAEKARIALANPAKDIYIKDMVSNPQLLKDFIDQSQGRIEFDDTNNSGKFIAPEYVRDPPLWDNMQKPVNYFNKGLKGDCEDISVSVASIFRHYGFPVRVVDGYRKEDGAVKGHCWAEIIIDGQPFYLGERGMLEPLSAAIADYNLTRPKPSSWHGFAWNETGQTAYKEKWWVNNFDISFDTTKAFPGGQVGIKVTANTKTPLDLEFTIKDPFGNRTPSTVKTDANGIFNTKLPLKPDAATGTYYVEVLNTETKVANTKAFFVNPLVISAEMLTAPVTPGIKVNIGVKLSVPVKTAIQIDGVSYTWWTQEGGIVFPQLLIPDNYKPGEHSLTINAPEYQLSTTLKYTVTAVINVNIMPEEVAPGEVFIINVNVKPAGATRITLQGYDGRWMTDADGFAFPTLSVPANATPGKYHIVVEAPQLGVTATATYTVTKTPQGNTDFNAGAIEMELGMNIVDADGMVTSETGTWGGTYISGAMKGKTFQAKGVSFINAIKGQATYNIVVSDDFGRVVSGSFSFTGEQGQQSSFNISDIPRSEELETVMLAQKGVVCRVYEIDGSVLIDHMSNFSATDPTATASFSGYWADASCRIIVVLAIATESQINEINNN